MSETPERSPAIRLIDSWLADESGYDERVWPKLKRTLNDNRRRTGERLLFREGRKA